jgi:hypothetical protein
MAAFVRSFLAFLLVVTLFGATVHDAQAGLAAEIAAVSDPCCDGDCPADPACGATCMMMMMRCAVPTLALLQAAEHKFISPEISLSFLMQVQPPSTGLPPDGLKRPPRI